MISKVVFAPSPARHSMVLNGFSAIINVSDTPEMLFDQPPVPYFWFPIAESGYWGHAPFYAAAKIVDKFQVPGKRILIHCHGGVCRSVVVATAIVLAERDEENLALLKKLTRDPEGDLQDEIRKGKVPGDIIPFLKLRHQQPTFSVDGLLGMLKSPYLWSSKKFKI